MDDFDWGDWLGDFALGSFLSFKGGALGAEYGAGLGPWGAAAGGILGTVFGGALGEFIGNLDAPEEETEDQSDTFAFPSAPSSIETFGTQPPTYRLPSGTPSANSLNALDALLGPSRLNAGTY